MEVGKDDIILSCFYILIRFTLYHHSISCVKLRVLLPQRRKLPCLRLGFHILHLTIRAVTHKFKLRVESAKEPFDHELSMRSVVTRPYSDINLFFVLEKKLKVDLIQVGSLESYVP